eukprot:112272_1
MFQLSQLSLLSLILSLAALSVSGQTVLRFEGGADLSAWINELEFIIEPKPIIITPKRSDDKYTSYTSTDARYVLFKQECTMNGGAVQRFWIMADLEEQSNVAGNNYCDQAIVRCRSSETASLQSCDGRWAFKQDRGEPGTNPFVFVGTVTTSTGEATEEAATGSTGSAGSAGDATEVVQEETPSCIPLMEMIGDEAVNGIEWLRIPDLAREHGEAEYYYTSPLGRLYQEYCASHNMHFWVIVGHDQEIEGDCEATIGRCRQMELAMCDGSTVGRQWAFLGPKGGRHRFPDVKVDRFWNDCDEEN